MQQVKPLKNLNKNPKDKKDVMDSGAKLHVLGHVCYLRDLPIELQKMLKENPVQNFTPRRAV